MSESAGQYSVVTVDSAVAKLSDHLLSVGSYDRDTVLSLFTLLTVDPTMHESVAMGLKSLKRANQAPSKRSEPETQGVESKAA